MLDEWQASPVLSATVAVAYSLAMVVTATRALHDASTCARQIRTIPRWHRADTPSAAAYLSPAYTAAAASSTFSPGYTHNTAPLDASQLILRTSSNVLCLKHLCCLPRTARPRLSRVTRNDGTRHHRCIPKDDFAIALVWFRPHIFAQSYWASDAPQTWTFIHMMCSHAISSPVSIARLPLLEWPLSRSSLLLASSEVLNSATHFDATASLAQ
ncbi:hypothetical protein P171DRAFT_482811 [Karstenula rhodostoma CBS 690.94]|uniref:Uncharacterized protein n=1 Tax=Karstenula rhodostoma CBS 690.94 TaxID=1392251 RepID=A0A9P4PPQ0_9PLEO|nr:hypothetical protein P171DRAFT_482811 [Karstenula rhodostoma CBS 690.94]